MTTLEEIARRVEKLEREIAGIRTGTGRSSPSQEEKAEAIREILRIGEVVGKRLQGQEVSFCEDLLKQRMESE
jgi:hypothetical protein